MKKLTIKEIKEMSLEDLRNMLTDEQCERIQNIKLTIQDVYYLLSESSITANQEDNEEHTSIDEYIEYLEDNRNEQSYNESEVD